MSPPRAILLTFAMVLRGETDIAGVDLLADMDSELWILIPERRCWKSNEHPVIHTRMRIVKL